MGIKTKNKRIVAIGRANETSIKEVERTLKGGNISGIENPIFPGQENQQVTPGKSPIVLQGNF